MEQDRQASPDVKVRQEAVGEGRRALVVPGRFTVSWRPANVSALNRERRDRFRIGLAVVEQHMDFELGLDPEELSDYSLARSGSAIYLVELINTPGATIEYPSRNVRYHLGLPDAEGSCPYIAEAIDPTQPLDPLDQNANGSIPNPWNL